MAAGHEHKQLSPAALHRRFGQLLAAGGKSDQEVLEQHFQFIRDNDADVAEAQKGGAAAWAVRFAQKYYAKLSKTYVLVDLSRYKTGAVGMRWRTGKEVVAGKGQFACGSLSCSATADLVSLEVPFSYSEGGTQKAALVTARLCPLCAQRLLVAREVEGGEGSGTGDAHLRKRRRDLLRAAEARPDPAADTGATKLERSKRGSAKRSRSPPSHAQHAPTTRPGHSSKRSRRSHSAGSRAKRSPSATSSAAGSLQGLSDEALLQRLLL